jgi:hypothetical protein
MRSTACRPPRFAAALGAALLLAASAAAAHDFTLGALKLDHPWARASAGPAGNGAAFLVIENSGDEDRLVAVAGDVAERAELHTHTMAGDVMQMRRVEAVEIPAHGSAALQPGGLHIMLIGLKQPLREGERFPLTLTFDKAGAVTVEFAVEGVGSMGPQGTGHGGMGHGSMDPGTMHQGTTTPSN